MGLFQTIRNLFTRSKNHMTNYTTSGRLDSVTDHPRIAVTADEYDRIRTNLQYFKSEFDHIRYLNSDGDMQTRAFNDLPIGRTAAKKLASLVYNEKAQITVADEQANEFLQKTLNDDRFNKNFERYLESCLALGGLAMRPYIDGDKVRVAFVQAPVFFPLQSNTQDVSSAAILTKTRVADGRKYKYYSLLEFHDWTDKGEEGNAYTITNELYRSDTADALGERVALSELYEDLAEVVNVEGITRPLFTYLKPAGMNNKDINSPLGLSIYDNAKPTIDFINRTFDEYMWEVRMGQRRVIVPESMTRSKLVQDEHGHVTTRQRFDTDQNVFVAIGGGLDGNQIVDVTTAIRAEQYIATINQGLKLFEMLIGVSSGMFTFDGDGIKTATEVVSENSDTYQTRNSLVTLVEQSLKELAVSILELAAGAGLYSGHIVTVDDVSVDLDDGVFTDRQAELNYWSQMYAAGACSRLTFIMKTRNLTEEEALQEITAIDGELPRLPDLEEEIYKTKQQQTTTDGEDEDEKTPQDAQGAADEV